MNKINLYELLGLIKIKKAPGKVLIKDKVYYLLKDNNHYVYSQSKDVMQWEFKLDHKICITECLDLEVIILDNTHQDSPFIKKIKKPTCHEWMTTVGEDLYKQDMQLYDKVNEIIVYIIDIYSILNEHLEQINKQKKY